MPKMPIPILACLLLTACGGGGSETAVSASPPAASQPIAATPTAPPSEPEPPSAAPAPAPSPGVSAPAPTPPSSEQPSTSQPSPPSTEAPPAPPPSSPPPPSARPSPAPAPEPEPVSTTQTAELLCRDMDLTVPMRVEYDLTAYPWAWLRATIADPYQSTWVDDPDGSLVSAGSYRVYDDGYSRTVTLVADQRVPTSWTIVDGRVTGAALHWARATMGPDMVCE